MTATYHIGDTRQVLATLPDASVDLIVSSPPFLALRSYLPADHPDKQHEIGSEATPGAFLDALLDVVDECARVLAPHGSLCFELGDTYAGSGGGGGDYLPGGMRDGQQQFAGSGATMRESNAAHWRAKNKAKDVWPQAKSLCLIPQSFAFALAYGRNPHTGRTADPWRIRNIVRWWRPNPPVGALGDKWRPATSEITVACKSGKRYWDDIATRVEPTSGGAGEVIGTNGSGCSGITDGGARHIVTASHHAGAPLQDTWRIPTAPYKGSHYATYPPALVEPLIKAMCPQRVCTTCGEPSRRITEKSEEYAAMRERVGDFKNGHDRANGINGTVQYDAGEHIESADLVTVGWTDCGHNTWRRGVVLDPFAGTGTTLQVAEGHGRDSIGIDLDARNADLARERLGMFLEVTK